MYIWFTSNLLENEMIFKIFLEAWFICCYPTNNLEMFIASNTCHAIATSTCVQNEVLSSGHKGCTVLVYFYNSKVWNTFDALIN